MSDLKRILIVDDDEHILSLLAAKLASHYEIHTLSDPTQALAAARKTQPHLLLCDIDMPEMGGGDVVAALTEDGRTQSIPVVYLSGMVSPDELTDLGGYVSGKPGVSKRSSVKQLVAVIERELQRDPA